ncbi:AhpD family alkylhydroperoxidase [Stackebrandtia albiflava]|uniref:AhpD family alkylhydroperoxidase n=1 Tax=Stackebrandtia albiflava TaxID=406432 RepID=A0A562V4Q3_9ACTN|nr:carboxymuconolactone decarboxylase family protein [Stackebrandtia albiflava]TWJ12869.1 AhpD family alkylhydroperoxidase [Stackebrandtia albiflava]
MSFPVRHVTPVTPETATGLVARVYRQVRDEFSSIGPAVRMLTPADQITAAAWSLLRESQLAGDAPMLGKVMIALGVAQANRCDYDVHSYLAMLRIAGAEAVADEIETRDVPRDPALAEPLTWARATGDHPVPISPLAPAYRAEYLGTALFTHFINRMVAAMLPADLRPGTLRPEDPPPFDGAPVFRPPTTVPAGRSLELLETGPRGTVAEWAGDSPVGVAHAALVARTSQGAGLLTPRARTAAETVIADHHGRRPFALPDWEAAMSGLSEPERAGAELAALAGVAPELITDARVAAWRATDARLSDHCTVYLLSYGAMRAVDHITADLVGATWE